MNFGHELFWHNQLHVEPWCIVLVHDILGPGTDMANNVDITPVLQTELEECTEILSQMVNRLYLRTPRSRIIEQAHNVQRRRLEFTAAIAKGLVPPETPPSLKKGRRRRKYSMETEDVRFCLGSGFVFSGFLLHYEVVISCSVFSFFFCVKNK